jgi:hypothetical protein
MRIAFAGMHRVSKTTLLEAVGGALRGYATVDEPYFRLDKESYEHSDRLFCVDHMKQSLQPTAASKSYAASA